MNVKMAGTPHTCLRCPATYWTMSANGYSVAFQQHIDSHDTRDYPEDDS